jgi:large subunit ribosomal protein L35
MTSNLLKSSLKLRRASRWRASSFIEQHPVDPPDAHLFGGRGGGVQVGKESQMPKLKTKSGAKKRFKVTATGKVLFAQSGKRHGMIKRTTKQIRDHRGTKVLFKTDGDRIKKYWLPNG